MLEDRRERPDRYERAALRFVNHVRLRLGAHPVRALSSGVPDDLLLSPLATSAASHFAEVWGDDMVVALDLRYCRRFRLSRDVAEFVMRYDALHYPHLISWKDVAGQLLGEVPSTPPRPENSVLRGLVDVATVNPRLSDADWLALERLLAEAASGDAT